MSTRGWKECRRRRTFPVTRRLSTNRVPKSTPKRRFLGKFDPLRETFLEYETICREKPPGHVFVESLAEIDPRKVHGRSGAWFTSQKNNASATHFFALSPKPIARFRWKRAMFSLFRPQPHLPSFMNVHPNPSKSLRFISDNDVPDRIADKNANG